MNNNIQHNIHISKVTYLEQALIKLSGTTGPDVINAVGLWYSLNTPNQMFNIWDTSANQGLGAFATNRDMDGGAEGTWDVGEEWNVYLK